MSLDGYGIQLTTFPRSAFEGLAVVTPSSGLVVSLNEQKRHLRVESQEEDKVIRGFIQSATEWAEAFLYRQLLTATYRLQLDSFPDSDRAPIELPRPPLRSVTQIQYYDTASTLQTWGSTLYQVDTVSEPGRLMPVPDGSYPDTQDDRFGAVQVTFEAGYGEAADVPEEIKTGIKMLAASLFERREDDIVASLILQVPRGVENLLYPFKVADFV